MSDLTRFRDHCRRMGGPPTQQTSHLTPMDRALFRALASEVDSYLAREHQDPTPTPDDQPLDFDTQETP